MPRVPARDEECQGCQVPLRYATTASSYLGSPGQLTTRFGELERSWGEEGTYRAPRTTPQDQVWIQSMSSLIRASRPLRRLAPTSTAALSRRCIWGVGEPTADSLVVPLPDVDSVSPLSSGPSPTQVRHAPQTTDTLPMPTEWRKRQRIDISTAHRGLPSAGNCSRKWS